MAVKTFTVSEVLTASDTNTYLANSGLVYVGGFSLSALSNNITSVFSSTYDAYRVVISNFYSTTTTTRIITMRMLTGATPDTGATYYWNNQYIYNAGTNGTTGANLDTSMRIGFSASNASGQSMVLEIVNPNLATSTTVSYDSIVYQSDASNFVGYKGWGVANTGSQYTGFQIIGTTDALSGQVRVYGYRKA